MLISETVKTILVAVMLFVLFLVCFFAYFGKDRRSLESQREDMLFTNKLNFNKKEKSRIFNEDIKSGKVSVSIKSGNFEGTEDSIMGSKVYRFLGIPYAEPPIGKLRFSSPQPIERWLGNRKAVNYSAICPQNMFSTDIWPMNFVTTKTSEDCLTLNIWTPTVRPIILKTVMVWIHGGAFLAGSANLHETDGKILSAFGDVVIVSINYRLGVLGFLNTRTEGAPGNMGIYDQTLALQWIKDNIRHFGGDPNKIVPFGQSAGAISIGILMSYNQTNDLFSRAITQSGSFLLPEMSTVFDNSVIFAKRVGCLKDYDESDGPFDSFSDEEVQCLKDLDYEKLTEESNKFLENSLNPFVPVSDGYYEDLETPMNYIIDENAFSEFKQLLSGVTRDEGTFFTQFMSPKLFNRKGYPKLKTLSETRKMFEDLAKNKSDIPEKMTTFASNSLIDGPEVDTHDNNNKRINDAFGDMIITCPTVYLADELVAKNKSVYMYLFDQRPDKAQFGKWLGVTHYEEVPYVFGYPLNNQNKYSKHDIALSERLIKTWTHFAKTGYLSHNSIKQIKFRSKVGNLKYITYPLLANIAPGQSLKKIILKIRNKTSMKKQIF